MADYIEYNESEKCLKRHVGRTRDRNTHDHR